MITNKFLWLDIAIFPWIIFSLVLNCLVVFAWHRKLYLHLNLKKYQGIQRIHLNEVPRLGGIIFFAGLLGYSLSSPFEESANLIKQFIFCLMPSVLISLKEDLFHNVEPTTRLMMLLFSAWLFGAIYAGPLPDLNNIIFVEKLTAMPGALTLFFILGMVSISNGMNLIDGVNGLCGFTCLSILLTLLFLAHKVGDQTLLIIILAFVALLLPFLFFNYPYGRIFLGDLGAYSLGLLISMLTIILFGRHSELSPWIAPLILIYPAIEVAFSLMRRAYKRKPIFTPDIEHLHLKIFYSIKSISQYKKIANAAVSPILSSLWLYPLITIPWVYQTKNLVILAIILFVFIYIVFTQFISQKNVHLSE